MDAGPDSFSIVVSDIKTDGSYSQDLYEFVRDSIIEDGGSYTYANFWNYFGQNLKSEQGNLMVIAPTEDLMEKIMKKKRFGASVFKIEANDDKLRLLKGLFDLTHATIQSVKPEKGQTVTKVTDALEINWSSNGLIPEFVTDLTNGTKIRVEKHGLRVYNGRKIIFLYILGLLSSPQISSELFK